MSKKTKRERARERRTPKKKKKKTSFLSSLPYRQVRPVQVPHARPPLSVVPGPRRGRGPPDDGLSDAEVVAAVVAAVAAIAAAAEAAVVCPRVGRGGGDDAAQQARGLGLPRHRALRERVLDVHPADELGEAGELLGRDADVFEDGPGAELALGRGEERRSGGVLKRRRERRRRRRRGRERDDVGPCACRGGRQGPRGAEERVQAGGPGGGFALGREGLES